MDLSGKNIMLTGGTGSFGKACIDALLERDPRIIRVVEHHEPAVGAGLEPAAQPLSPDHAVLHGRSAVNLLIQSAHGRSEGEAVRGAEPPHLIGGMLPVEQPMGVLQGECRLADAPQADQGLGDHDWAHKGRTWKGAGCAPFTGRVEELAWLRQAAGVPQRRKDSTSRFGRNIWL